MAQRRMFSKAVVESDDYLDLPLTAQALYFHLAMRADDDGFVGNPRSTMRMIGAGKEDFSMLEEAGFLRTFDSGVVLILHWNEHNNIRKDRHKRTVYQKEMAEVMADSPESFESDNGLSTNCQPECSQVTAQDRLGKDRLGKDRIGKDRIGEDRIGEDRIGEDRIGEDRLGKDRRGEDRIGEDSAGEDNRGEDIPEAETEDRTDEKARARERVFSLYNQICKSLVKAFSLTEGREKQIDRLLSKYSEKEIEDVFRKANASVFLRGRRPEDFVASFDWLTEERNFLKVMEGNYDSNRNAGGVYECSYDLEALERMSMFD